ncbi:MAG: IS110 family transposase [Nanoarchaeota archaeon]
MTSTHAKYIGLDIHKKFVYAVVMDNKGTITSEKKVRNDPYELEKFFKDINKDSNVALESCSCWEYIYDYLTDMGFTNLSLANPLKVRLIATSKKKTDSHDAKILADLLRSNMLPTSYAPNKVIRNQRLITRHRASLGRLKGVIKNKIHAILIRNGINQEFSDVFGIEGTKFLRSLELSDVDRYQMDQYLELIRHYDIQIAKTEARIEDYVAYTPQVKLLMTIPGISYYSGLAINGEMGNINRFCSAKKLVCFAGLNPSVSQSGDRCYTGHIAKQGDKHLRWMLNQCANVAIMHDSTLAKIYHRIKKRRGHNIAITAVARKMLCFIYTMLMHNIKYQALQIHKAS